MIGIKKIIKGFVKTFYTNRFCRGILNQLNMIESYELPNDKIENKYNNNQNKKKYMKRKIKHYYKMSKNKFDVIKFERKIKDISDSIMEIEKLLEEPNVSINKTKYLEEDLFNECETDKTKEQKEFKINQMRKIIKQNILSNNNFDSIFYFFDIINEFQNDKKVMLKVVKKNGLMLKYASPKLKYNKEIVEEAIKNNPFALEFTYLSDIDKEIVIDAVKRNGLSYRYVSGDLEFDEEIIFYALINENPCSLTDIPKKILYKYGGIDNLKEYLKQKYTEY